MIYKDFQGKKLSALGLGCMRLPLNENGKIDEELSRKMFKYAMENGVNYYDTAWGYHGGQSEIVTGRILSEFDRESFYVATKFPGYDSANMEKVEEIFEKQLEKTGMNYFDFYLFHCVSESNIEGYLDEKYGIFNYLMKQKENGRIRHLGFSAHAKLDTLERFLEKYGYAMEFGQLQINWYDYIFQKGKEQIDILNKYNVPVWVMEPVRGGKLVSLENKYEKLLKSLRPNETIPGWGFRFIQSLPQVCVTLSGMSNMEQLEANIKTFETEEPLNEIEFKSVLEITKDMINPNNVPCTACAYCVDYCPQGLNIPELIKVYNENNFGEKISADVLSSLSEDKHPSSCIGCISCEAVCPQNIKISEVMNSFASKLK